MSEPKLSEGSLETIMQGGEVDFPVMQILGCKPVMSSKESDKARYRVILSDGRHLISFAMIMGQVENSDIPMYSVIKINRHFSTVINNTGKSEKRILVILDYDIVAPGSEVGRRIGSPEQLPDNLDQIVDKPAARENKPSTPLSSSLRKPVVQKNTTINMNQSLQDNITNPIASLSPYQNRWVIKARVSNKSNIRTWSNSKGEGKLFSMDLIDESGEIRVTAFRDLVDKFYDMIEVDKVYYFSKCQLKPANKQFTTINNDFEMTLTNETIIQPCEDEITNIPQTQFSFIPIDKIGNVAASTMIDLIGVCKTVGDLQTFQARSTGRELKKREVILIDTTNTGIALTLWGNDGENFDGSSNPVIAIKGAKVGEFGGGKNVSLVGSSIMKINPDIPEAHKLRGWYDNTGINIEVSNISARSAGNFQTQWMSFREVKKAKLGNSERGDYYQVKATVLLMRSENMIYKACPTEACNKKLVDLENGMFRCEKCSREFPNFKYRLLGSMNIGDWSDNQWVSLFSSEAEKVLGMTAEEFGQAIEENKEAIVEIANKANFKQFIFKCRAKFEMYNDENRLKTVVVKVDPVNHKEYNNYLINRIKQLLSE